MVDLLNHVQETDFEVLVAANIKTIFFLTKNCQNSIQKILNQHILELQGVILNVALTQK